VIGMDDFQYEICRIEEGADPRKPSDEKGFSVYSIETLYDALFREDRKLMRIRDSLTEDEKIGIIYRYVRCLLYAQDVSVATIRRINREKEKLAQIPLT